MIRFLQEKDKQECIKMMEEFYKTGAVAHDVPKEFIEKTVELALNNSPYNTIIVCLDENEYAGFCHIAFTYSCEVGGKVAIIEEIYIRDGFKGKGLGSAIFAFVHNKFDTEVKRYRLEVVKDNISAIKLYENLGFKEISYMQMGLDLN